MLRRPVIIAALLAGVALACNDSSNSGTSPTMAGFIAPKIVFYWLPEYPRLERSAGIEGDVTVGVNVSSDGELSHPEVVESSGSGSLDAAALSAAYHCVWEPATRFGRPIHAQAIYIVTFRLEP